MIGMKNSQEEVADFLSLISQHWTQGHSKAVRSNGSLKPGSTWVPPKSTAVLDFPH